MSELSFDLSLLFQQTFGYRSQAFEPQFREVSGNNQKLPSTTRHGAHGSDYYANDLMANEYYLPVKISFSDSATENGDAHEWQLPHPVISITSKKTIIETPLTERRGTVKELINIQDYEIIIKGFIIGSKNEFPEQEVTMLRTVYEQNAALSIKCPLTDIFLLRPDRKGSDQVDQRVEISSGYGSKECAAI
ncbi:hypothetical protein CJD36_010080 [Flavipsychrobacter stenotrophus]|uniref:DUF6046 domain-containing protein n=1 Tax=Flavipsychrobacter stenotrophus TaxID=2077091 RepID=A0A2S7SZI4_9BACT|nr:DUF6046 domain-containing protein [Flavipsychrobacter stenotrophus]PQJ12124.1 hypothetical protein CJD36_010080 [Flavipsychrobacter stenotrophus]